MAVNVQAATQEQLQQTLLAMNVEITALKEEKQRYTMNSLKKEVVKASRPGEFNGTKGTWSAWDKNLVGWLSAQHAGFDELLSAAANSESELGIGSGDTRELGKILHQLFKTLLRGKADKLTRNVTKQNGFEQYRLLARRFGNRSEQGDAVLLRKIVDFSFGKTVAEVEIKFAEFLELINLYEELIALH